MGAYLTSSHFFKKTIDKKNDLPVLGIVKSCADLGQGRDPWNRLHLIDRNPGRPSNDVEADLPEAQKLKQMPNADNCWRAGVGSDKLFTFEFESAKYVGREV